jgi:PKD repeat protein
MPDAHHANSLRARLTLALAVTSCLLATAASALLPSTVRAAEAKGYGELTRFGETGNVGGKEDPGTTGKLDELRTDVLGVDPSEGNSVFVLDEPKQRGGTKRYYRLQKFTETAGTYSLSASVEFEETYPKVAVGEEGEAEPTVEGLAVDPNAGIVYILAVDLREKKLKVDSGGPGNSDLPVASTLYAFSTKTEAGAKLVPAPGTKEPNPKEIGVLTGPGQSELGSQSETPGKALLEPHGMTVDPATGEVIILAHVDEKGEKEDSISNEKDHYVLQRISPTGVLGDRYTDKTDKLKEKNIQGFMPMPHSPIVVSVSGTEHVYIGFDGLAEIPYEFTSSAAPTPLPLSENPSGHAIEGGVDSAPDGGRLTASPEGTIYGANEGVTNEEFSKGEAYAGLTAFSGADGSLIGWTGGQAPHDEDDQCVLTPYNFGERFISVAAGSEGKVFALAPEFLLRQKEGPPIIEEVENPPGSGEFEIIEKPTFEALPEPFFDSVVEFGPGGVGCPPAEVTAPVAKVSGIEVKGEESVKPGSEVAFSSHLKQADALKVVWNFGDGSEETVSEDEYQSTASKPHKYTTEGAYTVTETIYSDDLDVPEQAVYHAGQLETPTLLVTRKIHVGRQPPKAQFSGPAAVNVGEAADFESLSTDPEGATPLEYVWNFGDGTPETARSKTPTTSHTYTQAGPYTVTLTVYDQNGLKAELTHPITVNQLGGTPVKEPEPPTGKTSTNNTGTTTNPTPGGPPTYNLALGATSLTASASGVLPLKVECLGQSSCSGGTVTLRTVNAVSAGPHKKKAVLTLASGSFTVAGGQDVVVTLHLSSEARSLLSHSHVLHVLVTVVAHDSTGAAHTTQTTVTLRTAAKAKKKHR